MRRRTPGMPGNNERQVYDMRAKSHESGENYLEAILVLTEKKGYCRSVDVAEYLDITKPSVSVAVSRMVKDGYLETDQNKFLHLTEKGRRIASQTYEKHTFFLKKLKEAGVAEEIADVEACAMEHGISYDSFLKVKKMFQ